MTDRIDLEITRPLPDLARVSPRTDEAAIWLRRFTGLQVTITTDNYVVFANAEPQLAALVLAAAAEPLVVAEA